MAAGRQPGERRGPTRPAGRRPRPGHDRSGHDRSGHDLPGHDDPGAPPGRRRTVLTTRAAILAMVICALAVLLAVPARRYFSQRAQITELQSETTDQRSRVAALTKQVQQAQDPDTVRQQARERLHYQLPGEKVYQLPATPTPSPSSSGVATAPSGTGPWYSKLWVGTTPSPSPSGTGQPTPLAHPTGR